MKKLVFTIIIFFTLSNVSALSEGFNDTNFYNCIIDELNNEKIDGIDTRDTTHLVTSQELLKLKNLTCKNKDIVDLKGISSLKNITNLNLSNNKIKTLDLSKNNNLTSVTLNNNEISTIKLSQLSTLTSLNLSNNLLNSINLLTNTNLQNLKINNNKLLSLDVSKNTNLQVLEAHNNSLTSFISYNQNLKTLDLQSNILSKIDITKSTKLNDINISENKLRNIDLSRNTILKRIKIHTNLFEENSLKTTNKETIIFKNPILLPTNISFKEDWYSLDDKIVSFKKGIIKGLANGKGIVRYTCLNSSIDMYYQIDITVNVTAISDNNFLKSIAFNHGNINFDPDITNYSISVDNEITDIEITAIPSDQKSTVIIEGNNNLNVGNNKFNIIVIAEDKSTKTYSINIVRIEKDEILPDNNYLKSLEIINHNIKFNKTTLKYDLKINKKIKNLVILAYPEDDKAFVNILGNNNLISGTKINVVVTAQNGDKLTYVINIQKISSIWVYLFIIGVIGLIISIVMFIYLRKKY